MPVTCDGVNVEVLSYTCDFAWLSHSQQGKWMWVKVVDCHWTATSESGEVFKVNEHDPGIEILDPDGNRLKEEGTWRVNMRGSMGSHYIITWSYTYDAVKDEWSFSWLNSKCH